MEEFPIALNFTTIAVGIVVLAMILGAARGIVRMFFGLAALAFALVVAYVWYQRMPEISASMEQPLGPRVVAYSTIIVGVLAYIVARWISGLIAKPLTFQRDGRPRGRGLMGALLGLIPAAGLVYAIAVVLRLVSASESMAFVGESIDTQEGEDRPKPGWMQGVQSILDSDPLADLLARVDPFIDQGAATLSKILACTKDESSTESLQRNPQVKKALDHPEIRKLLTDPEIQEILARGDYSRLLQNEKIRGVAKAPELQTNLDKKRIAREVDAALYDESGKRKRPRFRIFRPREEE